MNKYLEKHYVVVVPGLGEEIEKLKWVTSFWRRLGFEPIVHSIGWRNREISFQSKLRTLIERVDRYCGEGNKISLIGTSAGGSAVLNAFFERRENIHKVINVCGRLEEGGEKGFRSFARRTASSPSFADSIKCFHDHEDLLTREDRRRVMTVRPLFGDELVPADTVILEGAHNIIIPTAEHVFSISMALTLFSPLLISFLGRK